MKKIKNELKLFVTLILSVAMLVTEIPMTAFATSTEIVNFDEKEVTEEQTQTEVISEEETTEQKPEDAESGEGETTEQDPEDAKNNEEETTEQDSENEENSEEAIEEPDNSEESAEEIMLSSASDFVINNGVLTSYTGTDEDVEIPDGTVEIGKNAFNDNKTIKTVTFPSTLTTIGESAFAGCSNLKAVEFNEGLKTIKNGAFSGAALYGEKSEETGITTPGTVTIPGTVQFIGYNAFNKCEYLGEVVFENGINEVLEFEEHNIFNNPAGIFEECKNLKKVKLPDRLRTISEQAFNECTKLEEVTFGRNLEKIGFGAFSNCSSLKEAAFKENLEEIGDAAFANCSSLRAVEFNEGLKTIKNSAFSGAALYGEKSEETGITTPGTVTIPGTVQFIGYNAFSKCEYLGEVVFENGINEVLEFEEHNIFNNPAGIFEECKNLKKVKLPDRLRTISEQAFNECTKLEEVTFGRNLEKIGFGAFSNCSSLKEAAFKENLEEIGDSAFANCSSLKAVEFNKGLKTIKNSAFSGAALYGEKSEETGITTPGTVTIPGTVQFIGYNAFSKCEYLGEVVFENGINEVLEFEEHNIFNNPAGIFEECKNLKKVKLPDRLRTISEQAFNECTKLEEVTFGKNLEKIGYGAFSNCNSLKEVTFEENLEEIGGSAFANCSSLKLVNLNEGLRTIGDHAFSDSALGDSKTPGTVTIPSTVRSIGNNAFSNCTYLGTVVFGNGVNKVLEMGSYVFSSSSNLTIVILPERITYLGNGVFSDNKKLDTLYIPSTVTEIVDNAIYNCPKLTIYGESSSMAETYAKQKNIPFKSKDNLNVGLEVQSVKLNPSFIEKIGENVIGKTAQLTATVLPATAQNKEVVYKSADEAVVTVNKDGLVTIIGYGKTTITVTTVDGGKTAECEVVILKEAIDERSDIADASVLFPKNKPEYSAIYTGEQICPVMAVSYQYKDDKDRTKTQKLKLNVDYTVSYINNVNAEENTAKVTVRGIGEYKGAITKTFTITPKNIKGVALSPVGDIVFDENLNDKLNEKPSVVVMDGTHELARGKDYEVVLSTTGSASADTQSELTVKGIGNYTGTSKKKVKFNILKTETDIHPISTETVSVAFKKLPAKGYTYNGKAQKPAVVVTDKSTGKKVAASYYKVIYTNNINAGTANVWVVGVTKKGKGYYGMISDPLTFEIKPKDLKKVKVSTKGLIPKVGTIADIQKSVEEALTVKDGKHVLSTNEYEIDYGNIKSAGDINIGTKYPITLTAKSGGNYVKGSQKVFNIKFGQLSLASKTANISVRISDAEQNEIILKYNGALLEKDTDYTAVVTKDKKKDTYTVKIKAVKNSAYKGSRTIKNLQL